jgi:hypothetical protein
MQNAKFKMQTLRNRDEDVAGAATSTFPCRAMRCLHFAF